MKHFLMIGRNWISECLCERRIWIIKHAWITKEAGWTVLIQKRSWMVKHTCMTKEAGWTAYLYRRKKKLDNKAYMNDRRKLDGQHTYTNRWNWMIKQMYDRRNWIINQTKLDNKTCFDKRSWIIEQIFFIEEIE